MIKSYSLGRYELFIVATVIGIVAIVAFDRYLSLAKDARDLGFEIISHHFMKGAANARVQWVLQPHVPTTAKTAVPVQLAQRKFYVSPQGWPASESGPVTENFKPKVEDCYQLWMALLQNPAPISKAGSDDPKSRQYHVSVHDQACRYQLVTDADDENYFFDYFALDGRVVLSVPISRRYAN